MVFDYVVREVEYERCATLVEHSEKKHHRTLNVCADPSFVWSVCEVGHDKDIKST